MPISLDPRTESLAHDVIGSAIEVHRIIGPGQLESVYHRAMEVELGLRAIAFESEAEINIAYKGHYVGKGRCDLLIDRRIVVELKTVDRFAPIHDAQLIAYLKNTRCKLGFLFNFNSYLLKDGMRRMILES